MSMRSIRLVVLALMFLLVFTGHVVFIGTLAGQTLGLISGTITDPSGAAIPGATVSVKSERTGDERKATSDAAGRYILTNLPPAAYSVEAKAPALGPANLPTSSLRLARNAS